MCTIPSPSPVNIKPQRRCTSACAAFVVRMGRVGAKPRVTEGGLNASTTLDPVRYDPTSEDLASQGEVQGWLLSSFIPLIITVWVVTSGIQPAIDMTAGERERGSMEALLVLQHDVGNCWPASGQRCPPSCSSAWCCSWVASCLR